MNVKVDDIHGRIQPRLEIYHKKNDMYSFFMDIVASLSSKNVLLSWYFLSLSYIRDNILYTNHLCYGILFFNTKNTPSELNIDN